MPLPRFVFSALTGPALPGSVVPFDAPIEENVGFVGSGLGGILAGAAADAHDEANLLSLASAGSSSSGISASDYVTSGVMDGNGSAGDGLMFPFFPEPTSASSMLTSSFGLVGLDSAALTFENGTGNVSERESRFFSFSKIGLYILFMIIKKGTL